MFRLIKLAIYGFLGYAIYEFFRGMSQSASSGSGNSSRSRRGSESGSRQNFSGPGRGMDVETGGNEGSMRRQTVGRGVVSR